MYRRRGAVRTYREQLEAAGYTRAEADLYTLPLAVNAEIMAPMRGLTPEEYLQKRLAGFLEMTPEEFRDLASPDELADERAFRQLMADMGVKPGMSPAARRRVLQPEFGYAYGHLNPESVVNTYGMSVYNQLRRQFGPNFFAKKGEGVSFDVMAMEFQSQERGGYFSADDVDAYSFMDKVMMPHDEFEAQWRSGMGGGFYQGLKISPEENSRMGFEAMNKVIVEQTDVLDAMYRPEVGGISFYWGTPGKGKKLKKGEGVSHIIAKHGEDVAREIVDVIANGEIIERQKAKGGDRVLLSNGTHTAVLSLYKFGEHRTLLLTGWENYDSVPGVNGSTPTSAEKEILPLGGRAAIPSEINANVSPTASDGKPLFQSAKITDTPAFLKFFGDSKVVDGNGEPLVVYHGTARPDRVGEKFDPRRATSGPMAFFTDDPEIGSRYAEGKQDTSLAYDEPDAGMYENWFRAKIGRGNPVPLARAWYHLPFEQRAKIQKLAPRVTIEDGKIFLADEGHTNGVGNYDFEIREKRGNVPVALVEGWLNGGTLFGEERKFFDVLRLAGFDVENISYHDPNYSAPAVFPVYLNIRNPLDTANISRETFDALEKASGRARMKRSADTDAWDKNSISPKEWMARLREDISNGTAFTWTRVPDWVTKTLKSLGYDGIKDTGGKYSGYDHTVWIPFGSTQVKSVNNRGTWNPNDSRILEQRKRRDARGAIRRMDDGRYIVGLFKNRDASTVLHETGHFFLENLREAAGLDTAPQWVKESWASLQKIYGFEGFPSDPKIWTDIQERFAREFEAYIREGKAPSHELRTAFEQFREWLTSLYRSLKSLLGDGELTPEVRQVFDRLLATDEEIALSRRAAEMPDPPPGVYDAARMNVHGEDRQILLNAFELAVDDVSNGRPVDVGRVGGIREAVSRARNAAGMRDAPAPDFTPGRPETFTPAPDVNSAALSVYEEHGINPDTGVSIEEIMIDQGIDQGRPPDPEGFAELEAAREAEASRRRIEEKGWEMLACVMDSTE
jgi:hypothetical protein